MVVTALPSITPGAFPTDGEDVPGPEQTPPAINGARPRLDRRAPRGKWVGTRATPSSLPPAARGPVPGSSGSGCAAGPAQPCAALRRRPKGARKLIRGSPARGWSSRAARLVPAALAPGWRPFDVGRAAWPGWFFFSFDDVGGPNSRSGAGPFHRDARPEPR